MQRKILLNKQNSKLRMVPKLEREMRIRISDVIREFQIFILGGLFPAHLNRNIDWLCDIHYAIKCPHPLISDRVKLFVIQAVISKVVQQVTYAPIAVLARYPVDINISERKFRF